MVDTVDTMEELRKRLEEEKERLTKELSRLREIRMSPEQGNEIRGYGEERSEDATKTIELEKRIALEENLRSSLSEVEHALDKFDNGTYGLCDECGQPIDPARLEVLPQANLCIDCKARRKKDGKGRYHR